MKAECIMITKDGGMFTAYGKLEEGRKYLIEDAETGTAAQRSTRESLITEYWKTGLHPKYGGDDYTHFRDSLKRDLGSGFEKFIYGEIINGKPKIFESKKYDDIPEAIRNDPDKNDMIRGRLKSCGQYGKKENQRFIDNLILDMTANGVNSNKFQEIMKGLEK